MLELTSPSQEREIRIKEWQQQLWDNTTKKKTTTKEFFPKIKERLKMKVTLTPNFTAMVTAHGKTRSYLHRCKIIVTSMSLCQRLSKSGAHNTRLWQTKQRKKKTNCGHFKRRLLASRLKRDSEQIPKTDHPFHKLNRLWKYVVHQYVQTE